MFPPLVLAVSLLLGCVLSCAAQEVSTSRPIELDALKSSVGIWDAEIEVWPAGPDSPSIRFKGVEENRPYGEYWIASNFDSEYAGQTMKVHSIVGYDLAKAQLAGTVIDHGPYAATMTGDYDETSKTVTWETRAKDANGKLLLQKTSVTQKTAAERILVLSVPSKRKGEFTKFMRIRFTKRD